MFLGVCLNGVAVLLFLGFVLGLLGLFLCSGSYLGCLVVLEFLNVLLLGCSLLDGLWGLRMGFMSLLVMFTIEIVMALVILVRVWSSGGLIGFFGW